MHSHAIYLENALNRRKMAVINGQPYYQSSGYSSGCKGIWFPFIMFKGTTPAQLDNLPSFLCKQELVKCSYNYPNYIVKFAAPYFKREPSVFPQANLKVDEFAARLPTRETLITSIRLGSVIPEKRLISANLDQKETQLSKDLITLSETPLFATQDSDKINRWLISQGAVIVSDLLPEVKKSVLSEMKRAKERERRINTLFSILLPEKEEKSEEEVFGNIFKL